MVKYITETLTSDMITELRSYVRNYLVYLLDDGFRINITPSFKGTRCCIDFTSTIESVYGIPYTWGDIKDVFIPFLIKLNTDYNIEKIEQFKHENERINKMDYDNLGLFRINSLNINSLITDGTLFNDSELSRILINVDFKND